MAFVETVYRREGKSVESVYDRTLFPGLMLGYQQGLGSRWYLSAASGFNFTGKYRPYSYRVWGMSGFEGDISIGYRIK